MQKFKNRSAQLRFFITLIDNSVILIFVKNAPHIILRGALLILLQS